ncbi:alcohol dehydrogenase catalytic domain-containing protein [Hymenobacter cellulosilyticus]|uniref:Alcohol dehydrogenase catalytic domain-containing protein n=1 Tax=Hymenobacter cellulosilyticus TaxID=2932248 RepID=A0A8T9Q701_9BACT|nr:alcohol dehydrogenase catalytic domain-containing protein [Hymenobacter cellulosilyticus]UOQ72732.1 alcohol dehydrogenase catalytic domain-containing protein [Hymenobacter cellulosilyticus]
MRKVLYDRFGDEQVLAVREQPTPTIVANQLLIQVKAASLNPLDWKIYRGEMKLLSGSKFPKSVGIDFAGIVSQVGASVTRYQPGDAVFGFLDVFKGGALAEYVVATEADIAPSRPTFPLTRQRPCRLLAWPPCRLSTSWRPSPRARRCSSTEPVAAWVCLPFSWPSSAVPA